MNFTQWKNYAAKKDIARITYVCGDQPTLVELVLQDIISILEVSQTNLIVVSHSNLVWETASQYSLDLKANRLIVVRQAEKFDDWEGLQDWISNMRSNPKNYIVFISNESDAPGSFKQGKKISYAEHIELIKSKGKLIKCSMPNDDDLISWACSYGLSRTSAEALVIRTSGSIPEMLNVLKKVHIWDGSPSPKALSLLCDELALDSFADYLIAYDKASAMLALNTMSVEDKLKALTYLDYRLNTVYEISNCVKKRMYDGDISAATGIKVYLVKKFRPVVKDYNDRKLKFCRQLIAMADSAMREGARTGVMESLVTLW